MELTVKHYKELTTDELYDIYRLRAAVFVVEQNCPYLDIDDADKLAYHLWLSDGDGIVAYARVLPRGVKYDTVSIGRVISARRGCGLGKMIVSFAVSVAKDKLNADSVTISAQVYARGFYEKSGFVKVSDEYLEDGIPHIKMMLNL